MSQRSPRVLCDPGVKLLLKPSNDLEFKTEPGRSTVGLQPLELRIGVRIPAGLPTSLLFQFQSFSAAADGSVRAISFPSG